MGCVSEKHELSISERSSSTSGEISLPEISFIIREPSAENLHLIEEKRFANEEKIRSIFLFEYLKSFKK
jgi:hypothetical protein